MKKIFLILVSGVLCLTMAGCGSKQAAIKDKAENLLDKALDQAERELDDYAESEMEDKEYKTKYFTDGDEQHLVLNELFSFNSKNVSNDSLKTFVWARVGTYDWTNLYGTYKISDDEAQIVLYFEGADGSNKNLIYNSIGSNFSNCIEKSNPELEDSQYILTLEYSDDELKCYNSVMKRQ